MLSGGKKAESKEKMIGLGWLITRARKKAVDSLRWRVVLTLALVALAWLIATYTIWR